MPGLTETPGRFGKYPVIPKEDGSGFKIILNPLTQDTLTAPAVAPEEALAPDMGGGPALQEDRSTRERGGPGAGWVDQIGATGDSRAQYTPPPDMGGDGLLSKLMPGGMGDTLASVAGGMNTIERTQSPMAGFAAGFSGAMTTRDTRRKDKRAEMIADEDRQWRKEERLYQRGRDVTEDERYARREKRLERASDLAEVGTLIGLDKAQIDLQKIKDDELADKFGMSAEEQSKADKDVNTILTPLIKDFAIDPQDPPETVKEKTDAIIALRDQIRAQEYAKYQKNAPGLRAAMETPNSPAQTPSQVDPSQPGVSAASALSWPRGQAPKSEGEMVAALEAAVAANGGNPIYYRNPATPNGPPLLYQSRRGL